MLSDIPAGDGKIANLFYSVVKREITVSERNGKIRWLVENNNKEALLDEKNLQKLCIYPIKDR